MTKSFSVLILMVLYLLAWLAPFLSPYSPRRQFRNHVLAAPSTITFVDQQGAFSWRPHVVDRVRDPMTGKHRPSGTLTPIRFLVSGSSYRWMGVSLQTRLFGTANEDVPISLLGSDALGRDLLSRILAGARFSLTIGIVGILAAGLVGVVVGGAAGYVAGWLDVVVMRVADLFLSLPGFFLVLGLRAVFPLQQSAANMYWTIVLIFTLVGWASVTRVIRGQVLSLKTRDHVLAARAAGASDFRILRVHILPFTFNYLLVQATVWVPAFMLGEVTLSFLGIGVQEPDPSWGNLLVGAASVPALARAPWLLWPAAFVFIAIFSFNRAADQIRLKKGAEIQAWW